MKITCEMLTLAHRVCKLKNAVAAGTFAIPNVLSKQSFRNVKQDLTAKNKTYLTGNKRNVAVALTLRKVCRKCE